LFGGSTFSSEVQQNIIECNKHKEVSAGYKTAHKNDNCLSAAESGDSGALYSVGLGFYVSGDADRAKEFLTKAADGGVVESFLVLGHLLIHSNEKQGVSGTKDIFRM
jgi:TPR repeat protein